MVKSHSLLSKLALCAALFTLVVIGLGAFTRLIDAGLGCPDWPGCYGHLMLPILLRGQILQPINLSPNFVAYKAWAEMIHRYFAGSLSLLILAILIIIFFKAYRRRGNLCLAFGLLALLLYQIMLGQWTVTLKLLPVVVSQHLLGGFGILSLLWLIYLHNKPDYLTSPQLPEIKSAYLTKWAILAVILLAFQIALGAWTSTNYASLSCPDFPFCRADQSMHWLWHQAYNLFAPTGINYEGGVLAQAVKQTIQMTHRLGALVISSYLFIFVAYLSFKAQRSALLLKTCYISLGLLVVQLSLGIINVMLKLPLFSAISHTLVAALLLLSLITLAYLITHINRRIETNENQH